MTQRQPTLALSTVNLALLQVMTLVVCTPLRTPFRRVVTILVLVIVLALAVRMPMPMLPALSR